VTTLYRVAPPDMPMLGHDTVHRFVGLSEVTYCTRAKMDALLREAFDQRAEPHHLYLWHKPNPNKGGIKYEGAKVDSWITFGDGSAGIGFRVDGHRYSVPIAEVVEMMFSVFPMEDK
jgi:hypothetical protein